MEPVKEVLPKMLYLPTTVGTDEAFKALTALARSINPKLPDDLSGHLVRINFSKDEVSAWVTKIPALKGTSIDLTLRQVDE